MYLFLLYEMCNLLRCYRNIRSFERKCNEDDCAENCYNCISFFGSVVKKIFLKNSFPVYGK